MDDARTCPVCQVHIRDGEVLFSYGGVGSKARLWARVCRNAARQGCINDHNSSQGFSDDDNFGQVETNETEAMRILGWQNE